MFETCFFSFTYIVFRPVRDKSSRVRVAANVFILDLPKKFCFVVIKCYTTLCGVYATECTFWY